MVAPVRVVENKKYRQKPDRRVVYRVILTSETAKITFLLLCSGIVQFRHWRITLAEFLRFSYSARGIEQF